MIFSDLHALKQSNPSRCDDPEDIYLVDHAWTFRPSLAREQLVRIPGLAERMAALMDIERDEASEDEKQVVDEILVQMWRFANTYWVSSQGTHTQLHKS